ncbi:MAG: hypothetical protein HY352_03010 [Candidatus Omnitrophica bacterium]|nr:hypothetical protein [Candidatus Omnitrophota bacterium]
MRARALGLIGLMGGVGGAINAWWCYAKFPVPSDVFSGQFTWHIVPAGAAHGALLALVGVGLAARLSKKPLWMRWVGVPVSGIICGWIPYIPISLYVSSVKLWSGDIAGLSREDILRALWPFRLELETLWTLFQAFGLAGSVFVLLAAACGLLKSRRLLTHVLIGAVSGCAGSFWWWLAFKPWYFSVLHGAIWGSLVGYGVWKSQQQLQHSSSY